MAVIPVLRCAPGVQFARIAPAGFRLLAALDGATRVVARDLWITSGTDSHETGRHPMGEAYDVRTRDLTPIEIVRLVTHLRAVLGARFTVLYETPTRPSEPTLAALATINPRATGAHVHLQPLKGSAYPPMETTT